MSDFITVEDFQAGIEEFAKELGIKWRKFLRRIGFRIAGSAQLGNVAGTVSNTSTQRPRGVNVRVETTQGAGEQVLTLWELCPVPFENIEAYVGKRFTIGYPPDRPDELHVLWPSSIDRAAFGQRTAMEQMVLAFLARDLVECRLTISSVTDPVPAADQTAKTTLYLAPFHGDRIGLYNTTTSTWRAYKLAGTISISLSGKTANTNYDVFIYNSSGTLTLELIAWTNDTTRATAVDRQDGVYIKSGDASHRWLGTIRITGAGGECEDSVARRLVYNYYNRVWRNLYVFSATSHTYDTASWRYWNNDSTFKADFVLGSLEDAINIFIEGGIEPSADGVEGILAVGLNTASGVGMPSFSNENAEKVYGSCQRAAGNELGLVAGYNYISMLEYATASNAEFSNARISALFPL